MNTKTAIVTGASRGIGKSIALELAANGYDLLINSSRSADALENVKAEIISKYQVKCVTFTGNIGDHSIAENAYNTAHKELGNLSLLINNAGISHIGLLQDMTFDEWDNIINVNLTSAFNMSKLVIPDMLSLGYGKIINISSVWGLCGASCEVAYSASKGALNAFTKALGKELAPSNIQVNAIACGAVNTSMNSCFDENELKDLCNEIPAGRMASPEEIAKLCFQLTQAPSYLTGEIIKVDGGWI